MSTTTTQGLLYDRPMRTMQFVIVIVCCLTNIADGVDIAALAFSAPVLAKDWGLRPGVMASLFGATAIGLASGAFLLGPLADRFGRRRVSLVATGVLAASVLLTARATSVPEFAALRFVTGAGLGTLAVCLNVMVAEFSNQKWRNLLVALLHTGFSIGTMIGGTLAAVLLQPYGWRAMFFATGLMNVATFLLVLIFIPESPSYLIAKRGSQSLERLNAVLRRLKQATIDALPPPPPEASKAKFAVLLEAGRRNSTLLLWLSQFAFAIISYLLLNWKPTVLVNAGLTPAQAGLAGLASGAAGVIGHFVIGWWSREGREAALTTVFFLLLCGSLLLFALLPPTPTALIISAGLTSFCNVGAFTGLLLVALNFYPSAVRTTSVGMLVGISRLGAITGPLFGGLLLELGAGRLGMFLVLAGLSLVPVVAMNFAFRGYRTRPEQV